VPLDATRMTTQGHLIHEDILQFVSLLTGVMLDQPVTLAQTLSLGQRIDASTPDPSATLNITAPAVLGTPAHNSHAGVYVANQGVAAEQGTYGVYIERQTGSPTANVGLYNLGTSFLTQPVTLSADPTNPMDAATKQYVDAHGGTTLTWPLLAPDGSAAAPSYGFASSAAGVYSNGTAVMVATGGAFRMAIGASVNLNVPLSFSADIAYDIGGPLSGRPRDLFLGRNFLGNWSNSIAPASNAWFQTTGVNSSTFLTLVPTGTGTQSGILLLPNSTATNTGLAVFRVFAGGAYLGTTGTGGSTILPLNFGTNGQFQWMITTTGVFGAVTDNSIDIGAQSANRPRDLFVARFGVVSGTLGVGTGAGSNVASAITVSGTGLAAASPQYLIQASSFMGAISAGGIVGGMWLQPRLIGSGSIATAYGLFADSSFSSGVSVNNWYGIFVGNQGNSSVTNAYGISIAAQSGASTTNIGLRVQGTYAAQFTGSVIIDNGFGFNYDASKGFTTAFSLVGGGADVTGWYSRIAGGKNQNSSIFAVTTQSNVDGTGAPFTLNWVGGVYTLSLYGYANNAPSGVTITNMVGIRIGNQAGGTGGGGQITNSYGLFVDGQGSNGTTNSYGIWIGTVSGATGQNKALVIGASGEYIRNPQNNVNSLSVESSDGYVFASGYSGAFLGGNAYYDGTTWQRYNVSQAGGYLSTAAGALSFATAPAGSNPLTATNKFSIDVDGNMNVVGVVRAAGFATGSSFGVGWPVPGDINVSRGGVPATGYVFLADSQHYLGWDGNKYILNGTAGTFGDLYVGNDLIVGYNTIYLFADMARSFYANGPTISYRCGPGGNHSFEFTAGGFAACTASAFTPSSARRLKADIQILVDPLATVLDPRVHGVSYTEIASGEHKVGFVADDWLGVLPEVVELDDIGDVQALDYDRISAVTFEALKRFAIDTDVRLRALEAKLAA
jgi:hypothetical protein